MKKKLLVVGGIILATIAIVLATILVNQNKGAENKIENADEYITFGEWMDLVCTRFNVKNNTEGGKGYISLDIAAETMMPYFGEQRLTALNNNEHSEKFPYVEIAQKHKIIPKRMKKDHLTKGEAAEILQKACDVYFDDSLYEDTYDIDWKEGVVQTSEWDISYFNNDTSTDEVASLNADAVMRVDTIGYEPKVDEYIVFRIGNQASQAMRVLSVNKTGDEYTLALANITDLSEVVDSMNVSTSEFELRQDELGISAEIIDDNMQQVDFNDVWWKSGLDIGAEIGFEDGDEPEVVFTVEGVPVNKKIEIGDENDYQVGQGSSAKLSIDIEDIRLRNAFTYKAGEGMEFFDFCVYAKTTVNLEGELNYSGDIKLSEIPLTMGATNFAYSVKLIPYIHVEADGKVTVTYEITGAKAGVSYTTYTGRIAPYSYSSKKLSGELQCAMKAGFGTRCEINVFGKNLADPSIELNAVAEAKTLDKISGFEDYPCVSISLAAPVVTLRACDENGDSLLYAFLNRLNMETSFDLIGIDNPYILHKYFHFETGPDIKLIEKKNYDDDKKVCTHKGKKIKKEDDSEVEITYLPNEQLVGEICEIVSNDPDNYVIKITCPLYVTIPPEKLVDLKIGETIEIVDGEMLQCVNREVDHTQHIVFTLEETNGGQWLAIWNGDMNDTVYLTGSSNIKWPLNEPNVFYVKVAEGAIARFPATFEQSCDSTQETWEECAFIDLLNGESDIVPRDYDSGLHKGDIYSSAAGWTDGYYVFDDKGEVIQYRHWWYP